MTLLSLFYDEADTLRYALRYYYAGCWSRRFAIAYAVYLAARCFILARCRYYCHYAAAALRRDAIIILLLRYDMPYAAPRFIVDTAAHIRYYAITLLIRFTLYAMPPPLRLFYYYYATCHIEIVIYHTGQLPLSLSRRHDAAVITYICYATILYAADAIIIYATLLRPLR